MLSISRHIFSKSTSNTCTHSSRYLNSSPLLSPFPLSDDIICVRSLASSLTFGSRESKVKVENEPVLGYLAGSQELKELESSLDDMMKECANIPLVINGKEFRTETVKEQSCPFDHHKKVARFYWATPVSYMTVSM